MNTSEQINELATALAAAQLEMANPEKNKSATIKSEKGSYAYKYADLAEALDGLRKTLGAHGLSIIQVTQLDGDTLTVITRLMHSSGQWIDSTYPVCRTGAHQQMGAALTYARRYALFAMVGIAGDDDTDGNGAAEAVGGARRPAPAKPDEPGMRPLALSSEAVAAQMIRTIETLGSAEKLNDYAEMCRRAYESLPDDARKLVREAKAKRLQELASLLVAGDNVLAAG